MTLSVVMVPCSVCSFAAGPGTMSRTGVMTSSRLVALLALLAFAFPPLPFCFLAGCAGDHSSSSVPSTCKFCFHKHLIYLIIVC